MNDASIGQHDGEADKVIADSAIAESAWSARVGCQQSADGQPFRAGRIYRQPLTSFGELLLQCRQRQSSLYPAGHILGLVLDQTAERGQVER